jgi:D-methionine transport system substrate-binding protein
MKARHEFNILIIAIATILFYSCSCNHAKRGNILTIGATPIPHAEILAAVKPLLEKQHIDLKVVEFSDYIQPNEALAAKELDANFFQHVPYLDKFNHDRNFSLKPLVAVHIEPMGIYSRKYRSISQIAKGSAIAIPNDPTNGGRALALLAKAGIITLKNNVSFNATTADIAININSVRIIELEAAQLPRMLDDVAFAVINTNYALEAKLDPLKDALFIEGGDSPYANVVAVRSDDTLRPELIALKKALTSPEVHRFIIEKYKGAIIPAY